MYWLETENHPKIPEGLSRTSEGKTLKFPRNYKGRRKK
jgi:hypothetical protein